MTSSLVIRHLGLAMLPALERPEEASPLFVEQVAEALLTHVTHTYGGMRLEPARGGLAPWQLRQATEMLTLQEGGAVGLAALAHACALSPSHFARAFKRSTGMSPHHRQLRQRIEGAKALMRGSEASFWRRLPTPAGSRTSVI